jgi:hypothetical protein
MKQVSFILSLILLVAISASGQKVQFSLLFPPMKAGDPNWAAVNTYVLPSPLFSMVTVAMKWSDIETGQGVYNFNSYDSLLTHFYSFGKKINIVTQPISPSGINSFTPAYISTPAWAASLGAAPLDVVTCSSYAGNGNPNTGMPVPYETPFKQGLKNFNAAVIAHYKDNPNIGYIRLGLAIGGDFFPRCSTVMLGFSDSVWTSYAAEMDSFEAAQSPAVQLMQSVTQINSANDGNADKEAAAAVKNGITIGVQGWEVSDNTAKTCTSDWCALFATYTGKIGPLELQTIAASDPTGVLATGSLVDLIPFAVNHHADVLELYETDWLLALDPDYATTKGATASYASYATAYYNVIAAASASTGIKNTVNAAMRSMSQARSIRVYNARGRIMYVAEQRGFDPSKLRPGFYYIAVKDANGNNLHTLKYVKN